MDSEAGRAKRKRWLKDVQDTVLLLCFGMVGKASTSFQNLLINVDLYVRENSWCYFFQCYMNHPVVHKLIGGLSIIKWSVNHPVHQSSSHPSVTYWSISHPVVHQSPSVTSIRLSSINYPVVHQSPSGPSVTLSSINYPMLHQSPSGPSIT